MKLVKQFFTVCVLCLGIAAPSYADVLFDNLNPATITCPNVFGCVSAPTTFTLGSD